MEAIASVLNGSNIIILLAFVLVMTVIGIILVRKGILSFNGKGVRLGIADNERTIIRNQLEYVHTVVEGVVAKLPVDLDPIHTKYVLARAEDVLQNMVVFNHITTDEQYVRIKAEMVYNTVLKRTTHEYFRKPEFKKFCFDFTDDLIKRLVDIRKAATL